MRKAAVSAAMGLVLLGVAGCVQERQHEPRGQEPMTEREMRQMQEQQRQQAPPPQQDPRQQQQQQQEPPYEEEGDNPERTADADAGGETPAGFVAGGDISEAVQQAERAGKPLLVVAGATWCGPCQQYKSGTLTSSGMAETLNDATVPVYVDVDTDEEAITFLRESGAAFQAIPFTVMIRDGEPVDSFTGARNPTQLTDWVNQHSRQG